VHDGYVPRGTLPVAERHEMLGGLDSCLDLWFFQTRSSGFERTSGRLAWRAYSFLIVFHVERFSGPAKLALSRLVCKCTPQVSYAPRLCIFLEYVST